MSKLHELLAAEKTPLAAWNKLLDETKKKFGNEHFFAGHTKSLKMIEDNPGNAAIEAQASENKPVATNVFETLEYALDIYAKHEDLQFQKNSTNRVATADVMWNGEVLFTGLPVDELLGLESRLSAIKAMITAAPTLDASKVWSPVPNVSPYVYRAEEEVTTKTEKVMTPVQMSPATDKHPAQVQAVTKDVVVGRFTTVKYSGACTTVELSEAIKNIDALLIEIKQARQRANSTEVVNDRIASRLVGIILAPFKH